VERSAVAGTPAEVPARRHADVEGEPPAPLLFGPPVAKSSAAVDGAPPHIVPRLASVGTPGDAPASAHRDALVGSCADPTPLAAPANEPVAVVLVFARAREFAVERLVRLASAFADGPVVVTEGTFASGAAVFGCAADAPAGALAAVPGPRADVAVDGAPGAAVVEVDAVTGSLGAKAAGPIVPRSAETVPPTSGLCGSGCTTGVPVTVGVAASDAPPPRKRIAPTVRISSSLFIV
jgi:hypothetical protein